MASGPAGAAPAGAAFFYVSQSQLGDLDQKLTEVAARLSSLGFVADFVTFHQHISQADPPALRGVLKLSCSSASAPPNVTFLRDRLQDLANDITIHPPYQFATQALLGNILNLREPCCGQAFLETVLSIVNTQAYCNSFDEFMKITSRHLRNMFAHSTEPHCFRQGALYHASKIWCFTGTPLLADPPSPFWENRDILSYIFTATPYAFWLPLCYQRASAIMRQHRAEGAHQHFLVLRVCEDGYIDLSDELPPSVSSDDYTVTFDRDFGSKLKAGVSYHVMKSTVRAHEPSRFQVCRTRSGSCPINVAAANFACDSDRPVATLQRRPNVLKHAAILENMPIAQTAAEMPSLLDSYFDYDLSLAELMLQLAHGCDDAELFEEPSPAQRNQHTSTDFRCRFAELRAKFNNRIRLLADVYNSRVGHFDANPNLAVWCKSYHIMSELSESQVENFAMSESNWLGLSKVEPVVNFVAGRQYVLHVRIPKAVKTNPCEDSRLSEFEKMMATLKTGSHIASAVKQPCYEFAVDPQSSHHSPPPRGFEALSASFASDCTLDKSDGSCTGKAPCIIDSGAASTAPGMQSTCFASTSTLSDAVHTAPWSPRTPKVQEFLQGRTKEYWLSEAGICTLEELFEFGVIEEERRTLAFRDLLRHVSGHPARTSLQRPRFVWAHC
jgi:hypothetical protein